MDVTVINNKIDEMNRRAKMESARVRAHNLISNLNEEFGTAMYPRPYIYTHVTELAKHLYIELNMRNELREMVYQYSAMPWRELTLEEIKLLGDLIEYSLHGLIKYDSKTFTFHYDGEPSYYERYMLELNNWKAQSWWRRLVTTKPAMVYPIYINPSKAV